VNLESAIKELSLQHSPGFSTRISYKISESTELSDQACLGIYRIVEQLLLNSLIHAECTQVDIQIQQVVDFFQVSYFDNGRGVGLDVAVDGTGTAIIDGWLSVLHGRKNISSSPGAGFQVEIMVPLRM
jgi:glucose-6-phosphate-specific signal transduction histidine kinase